VSHAGGSIKGSPALSFGGEMRFLGIIIAAVLFSISISPVLAADPPGLITTIEITGDNPLTGVQINGNDPTTGVFIDGDYSDTLVDIDGTNPDVYINGVNIESLATDTGAVVQQATPNSTWSGASTGTLPPLGLIPEVNAVAPGKYMNPVVGGMGYIGPKTNESPYVYKGSGCGMWGVSDGYPDLWGRRQMVGVTVDLTIQREKLAQTQAALVRAIGEIQTNNASIGTVNTQLSESLDTLSGIVTDLAVIEEENLQFREQTAQKINDMNNTLMLVIILVIVGFVAVAVGLCIILKSRKFN
jgi:hypothetical protein